MARGIKTGGRHKGTPNKSTTEIRSLLSNILSKEIRKIPRYLDEIAPEKRLQIIVKLLPYIVPTLADKQEEVPNEDAKDFFLAIHKEIVNQKTSKGL